MKINFDAIQKTIGIDGALALCDAWGGTMIAVPRRPKDNHPLVRLLGRDAVKAMFGEFGSGRLQVPMGPERGQAGRRAQVRRLVLDGVPVAQAAMMADVHERTGWNIKRRMAEAESETPPLLEQLPERSRGGPASGRGR